MRRIKLIALLGAVVLNVLLVAANFTPQGARAYAALIGDTPRSRIEAYVRAVARGDEAAALALWQVPADRYDSLLQRRAAVTHELVAWGTASAVDYAHLEWWRTCCMAASITGEFVADTLRATVRLEHADGTRTEYFFDVLATDKMPLHEQPPLPARGWLLRDVYRVGQEPLYFRVRNEAPLPGH